MRFDLHEAIRIVSLSSTCRILQSRTVYKVAHKGSQNIHFCHPSGTVEKQRAKVKLKLVSNNILMIFSHPSPPQASCWFVKRFMPAVLMISMSSLQGGISSLPAGRDAVRVLAGVGEAAGHLQ